MKICYYKITIKAWREDNIYVSCNDKLLLLDLKTFLLKEKSILSDQSEGHISINAVNSSVVVGRDNTVNATITETCPKDNKPSFWTEILQGKLHVARIRLDTCCLIRLLCSPTPLL